VAHKNKEIGLLKLLILQLDARRLDHKGITPPLLYGTEMIP
jgi:hypothetical protein